MTTSTDTIELRLSRDKYDALCALIPDIAIGHQAPTHLTNWTYEDLEKHMIAVQGLKVRTHHGRPSTVPNVTRYLRYLEKHECPVDLRPPSEQSWIEHIAYRKRADPGLRNTTINHYRRALLCLFRFLEIPRFNCFSNRLPDEKPHREIPPDDIVPRFWTEAHHPHPYIRETMRHAFHFAFGTGIRPPSEHVDLDIDSIEWDARTVVIVEEKKRRRKRVLSLPPYLVVGRNTKSLRNYVEYVRPRVDTGESSALWLNRAGRRYGWQDFRKTMSDMGKEVWGKFQPYDCRHWFATTHLRDNGYNVYLTARAIGDKVKTAEGYLNEARIRDALARENVEGFVRRRRRVQVERV